MLKNKKAKEPVLEEIIFWILNLVFFLALLVFVWRVGSGTAIIEENSAKQIALTLDSIKPGMEVTLNLEKIYDKAEKNKFTGEEDYVVIIDFEENKVTAKAAAKSGYDYYFFSDLPDLTYSLDSNTV